MRLQEDLHRPRRREFGHGANGDETLVFYQRFRCLALRME